MTKATYATVMERPTVKLLRWSAVYHMITQARLPSVTLGSVLMTPPLAVVPF